MSIVFGIDVSSRDSSVCVLQSGVTREYKITDDTIGFKTLPELSNQVQHLLSLRINSIGESHPRHFRGRLFNKFNTSFNFSGVTLWKSVPLG